MRLKPRQLEAFRHVMNAQGVTAAAEAMNVTQPAVSRLIRDLEDAVGMTLFIRAGARLVPTEEANLLLNEVERLYTGIDQVARAAVDIRRHKNVVLRIGTVTSLVRPFLHQAIIEIAGPRLDLPIVLDVENSRHIWDMVEKNRYDLGIVFAAICRRFTFTVRRPSRQWPPIIRSRNWIVSRLLIFGTTGC
jgi:DNA-binding transcriptional LysR family regulator